MMNSEALRASRRRNLTECWNPSSVVQKSTGSASHLMTVWGDKLWPKNVNGATLSSSLAAQPSPCNQAPAGETPANHKGAVKGIASTFLFNAAFMTQQGLLLWLVPKHTGRYWTNI